MRVGRSRKACAAGIVRTDNRNRSTTLCRDDRVYLPAFRQTFRSEQTRHLISKSRRESVPRVEIRRSMFCPQIVRVLGERLESQRSRGSRFLIGSRLSALDIYWAVFAALIEPLPENLCPMPPEFRQRYVCEDPVVRAATSPQLLAHRDFIYHEYLQLPLDF